MKWLMMLSISVLRERYLSVVSAGVAASYRAAISSSIFPTVKPDKNQLIKKLIFYLKLIFNQIHIRSSNPLSCTT